MAILCCVAQKAASVAQLFTCKTAYYVRKQKISKIFFFFLAFYGLDMELEPEPEP
jgi:hypothetical protein